MPLTYALIHYEDRGFGVSFPDFPGAITSGRNVEEAIHKASEMLSFHVAGMVEDGDVLPQLRDLTALQSDRDFIEDNAGAVLALIPFDIPTRAVR